MPQTAMNKYFLKIKSGRHDNDHSKCSIKKQADMTVITSYSAYKNRQT